MSNKKKPGRPAGSRNVTPDHAEGRLTRCLTCGSTDREPYYKTTAIHHGGVDPEGNPYTHIVRRWTRCAACLEKTPRIDRFYENRMTEEETTDEA